MYYKCPFFSQALNIAWLGKQSKLFQSSRGGVLIKEIGFEGIFKLAMLQKLSLKFSAWIMSKVIVHRQAICMSDTEVLG